MIYKYIKYINNICKFKVYNLFQFSNSFLVPTKKRLIENLNRFLSKTDLYKNVMLCFSEFLFCFLNAFENFREFSLLISLYHQLLMIVLTKNIFY